MPKSYLNHAKSMPKSMPKSCLNHAKIKPKLFRNVISKKRVVPNAHDVSRNAGLRNYVQRKFLS